MKRKCGEELKECCSLLIIRLQTQLERVIEFTNNEGRQHFPGSH